MGNNLETISMPLGGVRIQHEKTRKYNEGNIHPRKEQETSLKLKTTNVEMETGMK